SRNMIRTRKLPCTFYQQNRCKNGSACTFSHDALPLESYTPSSSSTQRRQCTFYLQNRCKNGSACIFSHDAPSAVPTKLMRTSWRPPRDTEVPPTYVEPVTTQQEAPGDIFIPCKFFQSGSCRSGIGCKFVHVALETAPS